MSGRDLHARLAAAESRQERAIQRLVDARKAVEREKRRINLIKSHIEAGPGHVSTPDPDLDDQWACSPCCRLCSLPIGSIAAKEPCPGDQHACQAGIAEGETATAFQLWGSDTWLCGQPGRFLRGFRTWSCAAGHRTEQQHWRCLPQCPCRFLVIPSTDWRRL